MAKVPRPKRDNKNARKYSTMDRNGIDIIECALRNDFDGVREALNKDAEAINSHRRGTGLTPLMAASGRGLEEMVGYLLEQPGIEFDLVDDFGRSALDHGRIFPNVVGKIMQARRGGSAWRQTMAHIVR